MNEVNQNIKNKIQVSDNSTDKVKDAIETVTVEEHQEYSGTARSEH
jgi:hypothetical protein